MKKKSAFRLFSSIGFVVMVIAGLSASHSYADGECLDPKSPLRGAWSYSQEETNPLFGNMPITAVGVMKIDNCGHFQGHGTDNIPCQDSNCFGFGAFGIKNPLEVIFEGQLTTQPDGTASATLTAFGTEYRRACVMMDKRGDCFQEFRCVATEPAPPNAVLQVTFKRQLSGSCQ